MRCIGSFPCPLDPAFPPKWKCDLCKLEADVTAFEKWAEAEAVKFGTYDALRDLDEALTQLINQRRSYLRGGMRGGKKLKAVIPGGSSVPIMTAEMCVNCNLDFESIAQNGSLLGSGGMIVMDETVDIFKSTMNLTHFYKHESCGWCTPCREGTDWLMKLFYKIDEGNGTEADLDLMMRLALHIEGRSHCPLGEAAAWPITSALKRFPEDFKRHVKKTLPVLQMA